MKARYEIDHYPNMVTMLFSVTGEAQERTLITDRYNLFQANQYVRDSYRSHGLEAKSTETWDEGAKLICFQDIDIPDEGRV